MTDAADHEALVSPKFDTLFAEARHFRGDCRLLVTAIRRGWLDDLPDPDRRTLAERVGRAFDEHEAAGFASPTQHARAAIGWARSLLAMDRDDLRAFRYTLAGEPTGQTTGRPRERLRVSDFPNRIDAAAIQARWEGEGGNPLAVAGLTIDAKGEGWERTDAVEVVAMPDRFRRVKLWLVCPRCKCRRAHLYPVRAGVRCRKCAGIAYADGE
ncbi:MAG TPA: hypothetical protein PKE29_08365 [Phycisphaerales bacterium]|nr:hypothetical protein [Phycisphaerales bacterium]